MKRIVVGDCRTENIFDQMDPDVPLEAEFEYTVMKALTCLYKGYRCFRFTGGFVYEDVGYEPDLALVADDLSHWFVIEVELLSHSLEQHVLPQVRSFRFGDPQPDCCRILARELGVALEQAKTLVEYVPRSVVVIANKHNEAWESKLQALAIQFLSVAAFKTSNGSEAIELNGRLDVLKESLGFGRYSSTDRSVRFPASVRLPTGQVQVVDPNGTSAVWNVARQGSTAWVTKDQGTPAIADQCYLQLIRSFDGRLVLKQPAAKVG